jgi:short-subunit dehydrogenase
MTALPWKTVWIVGASSGIGRAAALSLAASGVTVAASARDEAALNGLAEAAGGNIAVFPLDVTRPDRVAAAVPDMESAIGPIDLAILCAGVWEPFDLDAIDPAAFRVTIEVNYLGAVNAVAALLPVFRSRGRGQIAIVASVAGYFGLPKAATYAPTKAALINLAECLRTELDGSGVTISVVNPGFVETRLTAKNDFPMPFMMTPEDAAERMIEGLGTGRFEVAYPRRFAWLLKVGSLMPYPVFFWGVRKIVTRR